ncbi:MAG: hypothetical protein HDP34_02005 [Clostridia bacterium]|nr:hypothetical protein [Clostridia bacterium]
MKKKSTLLVALLSLVCLVCGAIGLAACGDDEEVVIKLGETNIGKVTAEGSTYSVEGTVDTEYKLTAKVDGEASDAVLIEVGDAQNTEFVVFTYKEGCTATFKATSGDVENVTVVMEAYTAPEIPKQTTFALTEETPVVVTDLKAGDEFFITVNTQTGKTYTVDVNSDDVLFVGKLGNNYAGPETFDGSEYVGFDNVATLKLTAENDVASVTVTLTVADTVIGGGDEDEYDEITLGTAYDGDETIYKLVITTAGNYTFTTTSSEGLYDVMLGKETDGEGVQDIIEFSNENGSNYQSTETKQLAAGTYYIMGYGGTFTVTQAND